MMVRASLNIRGAERVSGDDEQGVWQSAGYEQAKQKIVIILINRGSGSIRIQ